MSEIKILATVNIFFPPFLSIIGPPNNLGIHEIALLIVVMYASLKIIFFLIFLFNFFNFLVFLPFHIYNQAHLP